MNDTTKKEATAITEAASAPLPAELTVTGSMPVALALYLDDKLFERVSQVAKRMSMATGVTPRHLIGQPEACFAVVSRAITWKLDPFAVACSTYQTPGGSIGYEGKLIHAIMENSGRLEGPIKLEYFGGWDQIEGKFTIKESVKENKTTKYAVPTWTDEIARTSGAGVKVTAKVRGEETAREFSMFLSQCFPRNSTLWATDPRTQMGYAAIRRFASVAVPGVLMGVPLDLDDNAPSAPREKEVVGEVVTDQPARPDIKERVAQRAQEVRGATQEPDKGVASTLDNQAQGGQPGAAAPAKTPFSFADMQVKIGKAKAPAILDGLADLLRDWPDALEKAALEEQLVERLGEISPPK